MDQTFLLTNPTALKLYKAVKDLPIIDYHNHLSIEQLKENSRFSDVYELWIRPDPYKHRAMRMCGVEEKYITGDTPNDEKFFQWCKILPKLMGNPLYHWSMMELSSIFGIEELPSAENARRLYRTCNEYLKNNEVTPESLLDHFGVELACPCASLIDDIEFFEGNPRLSPSLRGDDIINPQENFLQTLGAITKTAITDQATFEDAVCKRLDAFERSGLTFADHALDNGFCYDEDAAPMTASRILTFLGGEYARRGIAMQLHLGAQRATSTRLREIAGVAGGYAAIGNSVDVQSLTRLLDRLDQGEHRLPKTILFPLNPSDNALISVLSGSYSKDGAAGLITQGPAWWWCDHKQGMLEMLENTAVFGVLSNFIGMTTDSRSFLSFVRHDYFRRVLCDWIGKKAEDGEFFCSEQQLEQLVYDLCYGNAKEQ